MDWLLALIIGVALGAGVSLFILIPSQRQALQDAEFRVDQAQMALDMAEMVGKVGTWQLDKAKSKITWSDEVFRIHERAVEQGPPQLESAISLYHEADRPMVANHVSNSLESGEDFEFEARLVLPSGRTRNIISRGTCRFDGDGKVDGLYGAIVELHR